MAGIKVLRKEAVRLAAAAAEPPQAHKRRAPRLPRMKQEGQEPATELDAAQDGAQEPEQADIAPVGTAPPESPTFGCGATGIKAHVHAQLRRRRAVEGIGLPLLHPPYVLAFSECNGSPAKLPAEIVKRARAELRKAGPGDYAIALDQGEA